MKSGAVRPLAGLGLVVALGLIFALAVGLFRGSFTETVPVTVLSHRAGLVMNPDAKVKMRGVQVGKVASIESQPDGQAAIHLAMDPSQTASDSRPTCSSTSPPRRCSAPSPFELVPPPDPSPQKLRAGQVIQSQHVTVEINTVFQQLTSVLDKIDPAKLNETLGAIATAFNGRGEKFGQTLSRLRRVPGQARAEPAEPQPRHRDVGPGAQRLRRRGAGPRQDRGQRDSAQPARIVEEQQQPRRLPGQRDRPGRHRQRRGRQQPPGV